MPLFGEAYGAAWDGPTYDYVHKEPLAKADTRLLVDVATSQTVDLSQYETDLTGPGAGGYESSSARTAVQEEFCVEVIADLDTSTTGILVNHGDTAGTSYGYRIEITASGTVVCKTDAKTVFSRAPGWAAAGAKKTLIVWTVEEDDFTAGTFRHELQLHNLDGDVDDPDNWEIEMSNGEAAIPTSDSETFSYDGYWNGALMSSTYGNTIYWVRIGEGRFHASREAREDWVGFTVLATPEGKERSERMRIPRSSNLADDGTFAGLANQHGMLCYEQNDRRMLSPVVNAPARSAPALQDDIRDVFPTAWVLGVTYQRPIAWLKKIVLPDTANRLKVRVHLRQYRSSGSGSFTLSVRVYSRGLRPGKKALFGQTPDEFYVTASRSADDTSTGQGGWIEFDLLTCARHWLRREVSYVYLGFRLGGGVPDATARYEILEFSAEPVSVDPSADIDGWEGGGGWQGG